MNWQLFVQCAPWVAVVGWTIYLTVITVEWLREHGHEPEPEWLVDEEFLGRHADEYAADELPPSPPATSISTVRSAEGAEVTVAQTHGVPGEDPAEFRARVNPDIKPLSDREVEDIRAEVDELWRGLRPGPSPAAREFIGCDFSDPFDDDFQPFSDEDDEELASKAVDRLADPVEQDLHRAEDDGMGAFRPGEQ